MKKVMIMMAALIGLVGCKSDEDFAKKVEETLLNKPEIVFQVIEKNPEKFMQTVQTAARKGRPQAPDQKQMIDEEFKNPKNPEVDNSRIIGKVDAPILIVEYSDLECPFCARGSKTLQEVKQMYGDKVKIIFKHLPLEMHPHARPAARYYEAIVAAHGQEKAYDWAKKIFDSASTNPGLFRSGDVSKMFDDHAKKVGANLAKVKATLKDTKAMAAADVKIQKDMMEARNFGIQGTPGFIINGVTIKGAYPVPMFKEIIDRHLSESK